MVGPIAAPQDRTSVPKLIRPVATMFLLSYSPRRGDPNSLQSPQKAVMTAIREHVQRKLETFATHMADGIDD